MSATVLDIQGLQTHFFTHGGVVKAVDGVDLRVGAGEILGLVGESGSGKSITGFSIIGLIDAPGRIVGGHIRYLGEDLVGVGEQRLQQLRGKEIAMIFQDPMMTLNPVLRVDTQMVEAIHAHEKVSDKAALARASDALAMVGIPSPKERLQSYPHQLSGGMRQRVAIAIAMLNRPRLIIADEPTTALDVTIQAQILYEVQKLCRETGTAMIWITHDLAVVSGPGGSHFRDVCRAHRGERRTADVVHRPSHPYTQGLVNSIPTRATHGSLLKQIPGMTPSLLQLPQGCAFRPRCSYASEICLTVPQAVDMPPQKSVRCWHALA
jgi:peptide/nickel transport system ATP-binding protein